MPRVAEDVPDQEGRNQIGADAQPPVLQYWIALQRPAALVSADLRSLAMTRIFSIMAGVPAC